MDASGSNRQLAKFALVLLVVVLSALFCAASLPKGSVWENHLADGMLFMSGKLPATPGYPMWGYSLMAGLLHEGVIYLQALLVLGFFCLWYRSLLRSRHRLLEAQDLLLPEMPVLTALLLAPFVFLSVSYFSNSLAQLFAFAGTWVLYVAVEEERPPGAYAVAAALMGLGFQFRTELLLLAALLSIALAATALRRRQSLVPAAVFALVFAAAVAPWVIYTSHTLEQPRLTSTNGGGSIYQGLGQLPDNPWGISYSDEFVDRIAADKGLGSPWSEASSSHFTRQYIDAVRSHPAAFARRVMLGWRYMVTQGVYLPKVRLFAARDKRDSDVLLFVDETLRARLQLNAHEDQLEKLRAQGVSIGDAKARHYSIIGLEYAARAFYAAAFVAMLGLSAYLVCRRGLRDFAAVTFVVYAGFLLFGAGAMQTNPRHSTLIVPVCLMVMSLLAFRHVRTQEGARLPTA